MVDGIGLLVAMVTTNMAAGHLTIYEDYFPLLFSKIHASRCCNDSYTYLIIASVIRKTMAVSVACCVSPLVRCEAVHSIILQIPTSCISRECETSLHNSITSVRKGSAGSVILCSARVLKIANSILAHGSFLVRGVALSHSP